MKKIGVVTEQAGETRVAATPTTAKALIGLGYEVLVEAGSGTLSSFPDSAYQEAGCKVVSKEQAWAAEIILKVNAPTPEEITQLKDKATIVSLMSAALRPELIESLAIRGITAQIGRAHV